MRTLFFSVLATLITTVAFGQIDERTAMLKCLGMTDLSLQEISEGAVDRFKFKEGTDPTEGLVCGMPHAYDEEIATTDPKKLQQMLGHTEDYCEYLIEAHNSLNPNAARQEATGSGSFPSGCTEEYPNNHAIKYYVDYNSFHSAYKRTVTSSELEAVASTKAWGMTIGQVREKWGGKPIIEVALDLLEETFRRVGCAMIQSDQRSGSQVWMRGRPMNGSLKGYAYFNNRTCRGQVTANFDITNYQPSLDGCYWLFAHELGHNHNLPHTFTNQNTTRAIMSYRRKSPTPGFSTGDRSIYDRPRDPSMGRLSSFYGGDPDPVPAPDDPVTDPPPVPGSFTLKVGDKITITNSRGQTVTATIDTSDAPPESLAERITAAYAAIPEYDNKQKHGSDLATLFQALSAAVKDGSATMESVKKVVPLTTDIMLRGDNEKWKEVLAIAASARNADDLSAVASGLGAQAIDDIVEVVSAIVKIIEAIQGGDVAEIVSAIIELITVISGINEVQR